jgi:predicted type IV restriction endonuclease
VYKGDSKDGEPIHKYAFPHGAEYLYDSDGRFMYIYDKNGKKI